MQMPLSTRVCSCYLCYVVALILEPALAALLAHGNGCISKFEQILLFHFHACDHAIYDDEQSGSLHFGAKDGTLCFLSVIKKIISLSRSQNKHKVITEICSMRQHSLNASTPGFSVSRSY
jgi:hypothetical protein